MHLVVQRQGVVAPTPIVADPLFPVDHQGIDAECAEPSRNAEPGLAAADDDDRGVAISIGTDPIALVEPVRPPEVAEIVPLAGARTGASVFVGRAVPARP